MDFVKYRVKYGETKVDAIQYKPATKYKSSGEYLIETKKLADNLQSEYKVTCSEKDYIWVFTCQGFMKLSQGEYYVIMSNGKAFIYPKDTFETTFERC